MKIKFKYFSAFLIILSFSFVASASSWKKTISKYIEVNNSNVKFSSSTQSLRPHRYDSSWEIKAKGQHLSRNISDSMVDEFKLNAINDEYTFLSSRLIKDGREVEQSVELVSFSGSGEFIGRSSCQHDFRASPTNITSVRRNHCVTVTESVCRVIKEANIQNDLNVDKIRECSDIFVKANNFIELLKTDPSFTIINDSHASQLMSLALERYPNEYFRSDSLTSDGKISNVKTYGEMNTALRDKVHARLTDRKKESNGAVHLSKMFDLCRQLKTEGIEFNSPIKLEHKATFANYRKVLVK